MITNERQYKITKAQADRFRKAINEFDEIELIKQGIDPAIAAAHHSSLLEQLTELEHDLARYEELRSGSMTQLHAVGLANVGSKLVEARIVQGLSQRELAERLGMKEQQIQRYEQERYMTANMNRLAEISSALGLEVQAHLTVTPAKPLAQSQAAFDPTKLPIKEMRKRGWLNEIHSVDISSTRTEIELAQLYISEVAPTSDIHALHRQKVRAGSKVDDYALLAWKARVLHKARRLLKSDRSVEPLDAVFLKQLVTLSQETDGPVRAVKMLRERGVLVVFEDHLAETHLDGAAMLLYGRTPVIGLTLRHNRPDNFWFVLMHEIGHVVRHRDKGLQHGFFDDEEERSSDELEKEADEFAQNALIPDEIWKTSFVRFAKSSDQVLQFASKYKIGASVVSGRIRRERHDYTLFTDIVGHGELRDLFATAGLLEE